MHSFIKFFYFCYFLPVSRCTYLLLLTCASKQQMNHNKSVCAEEEASTSDSGNLRRRATKWWDFNLFRKTGAKITDIKKASIIFEALLCGMLLTSCVVTAAMCAVTAAVWAITSEHRYHSIVDCKKQKKMGYVFAARSYPELSREHQKIKKIKTIIVPFDILLAFLMGTILSWGRFFEIVRPKFIYLTTYVNTY